MSIQHPQWDCQKCRHFSTSSLDLAKENLHFGGSDSKESACNAGDVDSPLGQEDSLNKGMANYSSILAWRIPWKGTWQATVPGVAKSWTGLSEWLMLSVSLFSEVTHTHVHPWLPFIESSGELKKHCVYSRPIKSEPLGVGFRHCRKLLLGMSWVTVSGGRTHEPICSQPFRQNRCGRSLHGGRGRG